MSNHQHVESGQGPSFAEAARGIPMPIPPKTPAFSSLPDEVIAPSAPPDEVALEEPLPPTAEWAANLPMHLRPHALLRQHAPLADLLALDWDDATATYAHLTRMLLDRSRRSTPLRPEVRSELLALRAYHEARMRLMPASWLRGRMK